MKILVLGGDGYCGWPTALHLSAQGHEVTIVDSGVRREIDDELKSNSLTPICSLQERLFEWSGTPLWPICAIEFDITDYGFLSIAIQEFSPDAVIHFAQQRSAPYSMIDRNHAISTQTDNITGTLNILYAIKEFAPNCHFIKLGTMGEYGQPNIDIEEGFLDVEHYGRKDTLPFPMQPGSFYHLSKLHDSNNIMFACRTWGIRATDIHQGIVYGIETKETKMHADLVNRFDYDEYFGTAINRFCAEAVATGCLTVYGTGEQRRSFINIQDVVKCIELPFCKTHQKRANIA